MRLLGAASKYVGVSCCARFLPGRAGPTTACAALLRLGCCVDNGCLDLQGRASAARFLERMLLGIIEHMLRCQAGCVSKECANELMRGLFGRARNLIVRAATLLQLVRWLTSFAHAVARAESRPTVQRHCTADMNSASREKVRRVLAFLGWALALMLR